MASILNFSIIKIAQGWQLHTYLAIIMVVSNINIHMKELH